MTTATNVLSQSTTQHRKSAVNRTDNGSNYTRDFFVNWIKAKDTIIDTLFILGPSHEERLADLAQDLTAQDLTP